MFKIDDKDFNILKENIKDFKRVKHSIAVYRQSLILNKHYNLNLDTKKLYYACLYHDICKNYSKSEYINLIGESLYEKYKKDPILHGLAGSIFLNKILKIDDKEILDAVKYHTIGHKNFNSFQKVVMIADRTDETRTFDNSIKTRNTSFKSINLALIESIEELEKRLKQHKLSIKKETIEFKEVLLQEVKKLGI